MNGTSFRTLKSAPIVEAVLDFRVPALNVDPGLLERWKDAFIGSFAEMEEGRRVEGIVQVVAGTVSQSLSDSGVRSLLFRSEARQEAVRVDDSGFSFSKLRPYTTWADVLASAKRWWSEFERITHPGSPHRLALRYINQFTIPSGLAAEEFLTAPPFVPANFGSNELRATLTRQTLVDTSSTVASRFVQAVEVGETGIRVLIDIDSFDVGEFDPQASEFWERFEMLRTVKNTIFFGAITPYAVEEFDK